MSEVGGPMLAALELPLENPHEAELMCVVSLISPEAKFSKVSARLVC